MSEKICPYCNEPNQFEDGRESMFCINCGKKLYLCDFCEVTCPQCHHQIKLPSGRQKCFCPDCGTELNFGDEPQSGGYHYDTAEHEKFAADVTEKILDRRHRLKIEKMRNKTALKMKKMEADSLRGIDTDDEDSSESPHAILAMAAAAVILYLVFSYF